MCANFEPTGASVATEIRHIDGFQCRAGLGAKLVLFSRIDPASAGRSANELLIRTQLPRALRVARSKRDAQSSAAAFSHEPRQRNEEGLNRRATTEIGRLVR